MLDPLAPPPPPECMLPTPDEALALAPAMPSETILDCETGEVAVRELDPHEVDARERLLAELEETARPKPGPLELRVAALEELVAKLAAGAGG